MRVMSACWEHIKTMREIDKIALKEGDFISIVEGKIQSYWSTEQYWGKFCTKIEYLEDEEEQGLYSAFIAKRESGNIWVWDEDPTMEMLASEVDAKIRNERIDSVLS